MASDEPIITGDQILNGIRHALAERNLEMVADLLKMLAVRDPAAAQQILDAVQGRITVQVREAPDGQ